MLTVVNSAGMFINLFKDLHRPLGIPVTYSVSTIVISVSSQSIPIIYSELVGVDWSVGICYLKYSVPGCYV